MTFIVTDPTSLATVILDSVLDYDAPSGRTSNEHNEKVAEYCRVNSLDVRYILETHVHGAFRVTILLLSIPLHRFSIAGIANNIVQPTTSRGRCT